MKTLAVMFSFFVFAFGFTFEEPKLYKISFEDLGPPESGHSIPCPSEFFYRYGEKTIVINNIKEYNDFVNSKVNCNVQKPPDIDFARKTLIGRYVIASGCKPPVYDKEVLQDDEKQEIKYIITVKQKGTCERLWGDMNWISVPKVPQGYAVDLEVKETVEAEEG